MLRSALVIVASLTVLAACGPQARVHLPPAQEGDTGPRQGSNPPPGSGPGPTQTQDPAPWAPPMGPVPLEPGPVTWNLPPLPTSVETYELQIPETTLQLFDNDVYAAEQPATFVYNGQSYPVSVRLRGASARTFIKKSWNVDFNNLRFQGREELNLVAEYQDQTMMVEKLAYDMLQAMGVPAPRTKYVRLILNGQFQGLYLDIEEVDKKFLKAHGMPDLDASIYRAGAWDGETKTWTGPWQGAWDKQTNKTEPNDDLTAFLNVVNYTPEPRFAAALRQVFDVDRFLRLMALEAIISNDYVEDSRSYYISDRVTHRWYYVPWDLNNSDARFWPTYGNDVAPIYDHPLFSFTLQDAWLQRMYDERKTQATGYEPTFDQLRTRILANPELRRELLELTERARTQLLDPGLLVPRIEQLYAFLQPYMLQDPYIDQTKFQLGRPFLEGFVQQRYDFLRSELDRLENPRPGLVISAFDPAQGWLELENLGDAKVSTSGLVITTYLRRAVVPPNVPAKTLAPGEKVRFTAGQLGLSFPSQGELGLFNGQSVAGAIDFLYYGALDPGRHYVRDAQGAWQIQ